jgi:hypothetical protein
MNLIVRKMSKCIAYSVLFMDNKQRCDAIQTDTLNAKYIINACKNNSDIVVIVTLNWRNILKFSGFTMGSMRYEYLPEMGIFIVDGKRKTTEYLESILSNADIDLLKKEIINNYSVDLSLYPKLIRILNNFAIFSS